MGDIDVSGFPLRWIPMDEDLLSMQLQPRTTESLFYKMVPPGVTSSSAAGGRGTGDVGAVHDIACAVDELVTRFGVSGGACMGDSIMRGVGMGVKAKGAVSAEIVRMIGRMRTERCVQSQQKDQGAGRRRSAARGGGAAAEGGSDGAGSIDSIVLLDRSSDLATPLATQHTYEGLIDELIGIRNGAVEESAAVAQPQQEDGGAAKKGKIALNGTDSLFREVRDLRFPEAAMLLHQRNVDMNDAYKSVKAQSGGGGGNGVGGAAVSAASTAESVSDLKAFVKKLKAGALAQLERHTNIATRVDAATKAKQFRERIEVEQSILSGEDLEYCAEYLETQMCRQEPVVGVLRLLCLLSVASGGIRQRAWDFVRKEFLQSYGYHHLVTLNSLTSAGLIRKHEGPRTGFPALRKPLRLVNDGNGAGGSGTGADDGVDVNYIYSGYAPLSVRLVQLAVTNGFGAASELMKQIPGDTLELTMDADDQGMPTEGPPRPLLTSSDRRPLVLVVFVGGVTFAEVSALRYLSVKEIVPCDFLIATTSLINGTTMLSPFVDDSVPTDNFAGEEQ